MPTSPCSVPTCEKPQKSAQLCPMHYHRLRTTGTLELAGVGPKDCLTCGFEFDAKHPSAKYCSPKCRNTRASLMTLTCRLCGEPMVKGRTSKPQGEAAHDSCRLKEHGHGGYQRGCRCPACLSGKAEYMRSWHDTFKAENGISSTTAFRRKFHTENGFRPYPGGTDWIDPKHRRELYERDDWTCYLCSSPVDRSGDLNGNRSPSLDHVIPRSKGGTHDASNLKTACRSCNSRKAAN